MADLLQEAWIVANSVVHVAGMDKVECATWIRHSIAIEVPDLEPREGFRKRKSEKNC